MENDSLVTICIPVFNGACYISHTLNSLMIQSYRNIKIIISDNASTDETVDIVKRFCEKDARFQLIRNKTNLGYCKNVMKAVLEASSDIIAIYHSDDIYEATIVEKEVSLLYNRPDIQGVFTKHIFYRSENLFTKVGIYNQLLKTSLYNNKYNAYIGSYPEYLPVILRLGNIFPCSSFMTHRETFLLLGGFLDTYPTNEDFNLWIRYLQRGYSLAILNEYLLKYRLSDSQVTENVRKDVCLPVMYQVIEEMIIKQSKLLPEERFFYVSNKVKGYLFAGNNAYKQKNFKIMYENISASKNVHLFPLTSIYGVFQRLPLVAYTIRSIVEWIKKTIKI